MRFTIGNTRLGALLVAALLAFLPAILRAQQGSIAGRVADKTTGQAIGNVQVTIGGTTRGALTDREGRYSIGSVSPGEVEVRARFIGYTLATLRVTVVADQAVTVDFALTANPVGLEAVTVTATGALQAAREIPNAVSRINGEARLRDAAPSDLTDFLNSAAPNVTVTPSSGTTGAGTRIRIRGSTSLSLSNDPVLVVDGIRVENTAQSNTIGVGGQVPSRLDDISPYDVETTEIFKGPSAAVLYGTDAANGAIQIRTRMGRPGRTRWTAYMEGGTLNDVTQWPANYRALDAAGATCSLTAQATGSCTFDSLASFSPLEVFSPFRQGVRQHYGLSADGGSEQTTFFIAGHFEDERGIYQTNNLTRVNLRANIHNQTSEKLDLDVRTGYTSSGLQLPQNDNNALGIVSSGLLGSADSTINKGYGFLQPAQVDVLATRQGVERYTGSLTATFRPLTWLTVRGIAGSDVTNLFNNQFTPPNLIPFNQTTLDGSRIGDRQQIFNFTGNFNGTASFRLTPSIVSNTTAGFQYFKNKVLTINASGRKLTAGSGTLNGVVIPAVDENVDEFVTVGYFVDEQVAIRDRLYLGAALRGDDNSAFGKNFNNIVYPKVSASWVVSEEPFFPRSGVLSSLRVRAAYGHSGRQPGPTDAIQFFDPVAVTAGGDVSGVSFGSLGNADLKPERTREVELGFDADLLDSRAHLEFTYYDKSSKDALIARNLAPSAGVSTTQFENLGQITNKGVEIVLSVTPISRPNVAWTISAGAWGNRNRLVELGDGIAPIIFGLGGASQRFAEGVPAGGYWMTPYTFSDANNDGLIATTEVTLGSAPVYLGTPFPTHGGTLSSDLTLLGRLRVHALFDGRFGHKLFNSTEQFRCGFGICQGRMDPETPIAQQAAAVANLLGTQAGYIEDGGYVKFRELSFTYDAPTAWAARLSATALSFSLAARNLATWTDYTGIDPELNQGGQVQFSTAEFLTQPPVRTWTMRINLTF